MNQWRIIQLSFSCRVNLHAACLCGVEKDLHALCCQEGLPARLESSNVPEAEQQAPSDVYIGVGCVVAMPVLVQPEQAGDIASVHCPAAVQL
ncbi:hypothetical protein P7K49_040543 [Saguinus oedipus]|uniref:Secreted protein n=1 Tax=Saguinus oedipus TaxID=9490 RepID=A0ABQ9T9M7_SAGOE|nr:hypothetical protein P7K49_040543 [Saguinus oedipus]